MDKTPRYLYLDALKGLCILITVIFHQVVWIFTLGDSGNARLPEAAPLIIISSIIALFSLCVPLLAGTTFYLAVKNGNKNFSWVVKRAMRLSALGFLMNFITWGAEETFAWDSLQFISLASLISYFPLKKLPSCLALAGIALAGTIALFFADKFPLAQFQEHYIYKAVIGDKLSLNYWPLLPWFAIFAAGIIYAYLLSKKPHKVKLFAVSGLLLLAISLAAGKLIPEFDLSDLWGTSMFKPSPFFLLWVIGFAGMILMTARYLFIRFPREAASASRTILFPFGQGILWVYLYSTMIGYKANDIIISMFNPGFETSLYLLPLITLGNIFLNLILLRSILRKKDITYFQ